MIFFSPEKVAKTIHCQNSSYHERIYSENRYTRLQNGESKTQLIDDDTIVKNVH